jgi:hypothetical protein
MFCIEIRYPSTTITRHSRSCTGYGWHGRVFAALDRAGMTREGVLAISERVPPGWSARSERSSSAPPSPSGKHGEVGDTTYARLAEHYDDATVVGIAILAGYYVRLPHVVTALELEEEFVEWELEDYRERGVRRRHEPVDRLVPTVSRRPASHPRRRS